MGELQSQLREIRDSDRGSPEPAEYNRAGILFQHPHWKIFHFGTSAIDIRGKCALLKLLLHVAVPSLCRRCATKRLSNSYKKPIRALKGIPRSPRPLQS